MPLVTIKQILEDARAKAYGIPCFLGGSLEMIIGAVRAAEQVRAPLILCFNSAITPDVPMEIGMPLLVDAATRSKVPVATTLDHGTDFDSCIRAIRLGSSSIMFDGSLLPFDDNVRITRELRNVARPLGVALEAELGRIGGSVLEFGLTGAAESNFTDPEQAVMFYERTDVDVLAVSFGNVHGRYCGDNRLDLERVRTLHRRLPIPLVMHGGSGLADDVYPEIIAAGISKINYYTAIARRAALEIAAVCASEGGDIIQHTLIAHTIRFYQRECRRILILFKSAGKA